MNIGIFTDTFSPCTNGVVDAVWRVCKGFQKEGHKVHLFALSDRDSDEVIDKVIIHKFKAKTFTFYPDLLIRYSLPLRRVFRIIKKERIEVLHSNVNLCMGLCALLASVFKKKPLITTFHTLIPEFVELFFASCDKGDTKQPMLLKIMEKLRLKRPLLWVARKFIWYWMRYFNTAEWLIVPSEYTKRILIKHGLSSKRIIVVPNPINTKRKLTLNRKENQLLHVGRLSAEKRVDVFIKALKYVKHDFKAIITSDGPLKNYLIKLATKEGVIDKIKFTGFVSKQALNKYYDESTLFVSAAEYDTFNNCIAEALAHGMPVIISHNSGATDFVKHGKNGLIINNDNPMVYAKKIDWLLFNQDIRKTLSSTAEKIRDYTSIDNITKSLEGVYNSLSNNTRLSKLKNFMIYGVGAVFIYSVIFTGMIFERK
ncbi:MAG: glycosyltransferase [Candidatus Nanoarchaeia archaeon]|jgi:glycosyltransferase involved in cell wall biosynthesis